MSTVKNHKRTGRYSKMISKIGEGKQEINLCMYYAIIKDMICYRKYN